MGTRHLYWILTSSSFAVWPLTVKRELEIWKKSGASSHWMGKYEQNLFEKTFYFLRIGVSLHILQFVWEIPTVLILVRKVRVHSSKFCVKIFGFKDQLFSPAAS